jgi:hypothetical protein
VLRVAAVIVNELEIVACLPLPKGTPFSEK